MRLRRSRVRLLEAARIILRPAWRPLVQLLGAFGGAVSLPVVLMGFIGGDVIDRERILYVMATMELKTLDEALQRYRADFGRYPDASEGLDALGPYLSKVPVDPWGRAFVYDASRNPPRIVSYGADGLPGGTFLDADLSSDALDRPIPESRRVVRANRVRLVLWIWSWPLFFVSVYTLVRTNLMQ